MLGLRAGLAHSGGAWGILSWIGRDWPPVQLAPAAISPETATGILPHDFIPINAGDRSHHHQEHGSCCRPQVCRKALTMPCSSLQVRVPQWLTRQDGTGIVRSPLISFRLSSQAGATWQLSPYRRGLRDARPIPQTLHWL